MPKSKIISFEESLSNLEKIVALLEKGELGLEDSLRLYEEGIGYIRSCSQELSKAQKKLEILIKAGEDGIKTREVEDESGAAG
ncbi:MAG: exodeoxyribonuclease VII small subunit [Bacillota bacterium]